MTFLVNVKLYNNKAIHSSGTSATHGIATIRHRLTMTKSLTSRLAPGCHRCPGHAKPPPAAQSSALSAEEAA
ncbi:MAG: hypothetical protein AAFZ92_04000 [Pseudomonadota bacterium]